MESENIYEALEPRIYEMIAKKLGTSQKILDIGCGDCRLAMFMAQHTKATVVGIDVNDVGFAGAMEKTKELDISNLIDCVKIDGKELSLVFKREFDAAVSVYALHELDNPTKVLEGVRKVLKENGKIIVVDFLKDSTAQKLWNENYYTVEGIVSLLKKARFVDIRLEFPQDRELVFVIAHKRTHIHDEV